jgi:hypothetical protein
MRGEQLGFEEMRMAAWIPAWPIVSDAFCGIRIMLNY